MKSARRTRALYKLRNPFGGVQVSRCKCGTQLEARPYTNQVILVDAVRNGSVPDRNASNLRLAAIPLDYQQITRHEAQPLQLARKKLDAMNIIQFEPAAQDIGDPEERKRVILRCTCWLLLDPALNLSDGS
jgi:hypothetical protein